MRRKRSHFSRCSLFLHAIFGVFVSLRVPPSSYIHHFHYKCVLGQHKQTMRLLTRATWTCCGDRAKRLGRDATENIYSGCIMSFPMVFGQQEVPNASASTGLIICLINDNCLILATIKRTKKYFFALEWTVHSKINILSFLPYDFLSSIEHKRSCSEESTRALNFKKHVNNTIKYHSLTLYKSIS